MVYRDRAETIAALIEERLGIRGKGLEIKLKRAGRLLPGHVRRDARKLLEAIRLQDHPKLARRVDSQVVDAACRNVETYLQGIDGKHRRMNRIVGFFSSNAFNLLATGGIVIAVLLWRGFI